MHELSLIVNLFEILEEKAREQKARKILGVHLRVGRMCGAVPELLQTAFDMYKKNTLASDAGLMVTEVPMLVRCRKCGRENEAEDYVFRCPACDASDLEVLSGTELLLEKIDLEVDEEE